MQRIVDGLTREADGRKVPVILFTKGGGQWLELMADTGCDALGLDWTTDIGEARARVGDRVALQGNSIPSTLYASPQAIRRSVAEILASFGKWIRPCVQPGHGIHLTIPPEHAAAMIEAYTSSAFPTTPPEYRRRPFAACHHSGVSLRSNSATCC